MRRSPQATADSAGRGPSGRTVSDRPAHPEDVYAAGLRLDLAQARLFTLQLSVLFSAGVPLLQSLEAMAVADLEGLSPCAGELRAKLERGWALSAAMRGLPNAFDETLVGLVRMGERSGSLALTLQEATRRYERLLDSGQRLKQALVYPAVVCLISGAMLVFMAYYMLPRFLPIFASFHIALPWPTRLLVSLVSAKILALLLLSLLAVGLVLLARGEHAGLVAARQWLLFSSPLLGRYNRLTAWADLCADLALMLRSGMLLTEALALLEQQATWTDLAQALRRTRRRMIEGDEFNEAMRAEPAISRLVVGTLAAARESGQNERLLDSLAGLLAEEAETLRVRLTSLFEPVLVAFMGGVVGFILLACFLPVYQLIATEL